MTELKRTSLPKELHQKILEIKTTNEIYQLHHTMENLRPLAEWVSVDSLKTWLQEKDTDHEEFTYMPRKRLIEELLSLLEKEK